MSFINKFMVLVGIIIVVIIYFVNQKSLTPSDQVVKNIATQYNIDYAKINDIKIIKSYEEKGKIVYILNIKDNICEMPMLEINKEWRAIGIDCRR